MREPVNRIIKYYHYKTSQGFYVGEFEKFVTKTSNEQTRMICGYPDAAKAIEIIKQLDIFVGITEKFDESMILLKELVCKELKLIKLRKNVSRVNSYAKRIFQDKSNIRLIKELNLEDIELYNYVKKNIFPGYLKCIKHKISKDLDVLNIKNNGFTRNILLSRFYRNVVYKPLRLFIINTKKY